MAELIYIVGRENYETVEKTKEQVHNELLKIGLQYKEFPLPNEYYFYTFLTDNKNEANRIKQALKESQYIAKSVPISPYNE